MDIKQTVINGCMDTKHTDLRLVGWTDPIHFNLRIFSTSAINVFHFLHIQLYCHLDLFLN